MDGYDAVGPSLEEIKLFSGECSAKIYVSLSLFPTVMQQRDRAKLFVEQHSSKSSPPRYFSACTRIYLTRKQVSPFYVRILTFRFAMHPVSFTYAKSLAQHCWDVAKKKKKSAGPKSTRSFGNAETRVCKSAGKKLHESLIMARGRWQERSLIKPINWAPRNRRAADTSPWKTVLKYCIAYRSPRITRHNNEVSGKWSISPVHRVSSTAVASAMMIVARNRHRVHTQLSRTIAVITPEV